MIKITTIGHVCIDENKSENSSYISAGSPAMFINMILKKFEDIDTSIVANYGSDYIQYLHNYKIYPQESNIPQSLVYQNVSINGLRTQKALFTDQIGVPELTTVIKDEIAQSDVIIFAPILPNFSLEYVQEMISYTREDSVKVFLPQGYFRDFDKDHNVIFRKFKEAEEYIKQFDFTILSENDYPNLENLATQWSKKTKRKIIITLGEKGAKVIQDDQVQHFPTIIKTDIVDSVGSGDIFSSIFSYRFYKTNDLPSSINYAHKVAGNALMYNPKQLGEMKITDLLI